MVLPNNRQLRIDYLSLAFNNTTNSYKFYWFLAILESIKSRESKPKIEDLIIQMISNVWYPINYFKLSFGKQDQFDSTIKNLQELLKLSKDIEKEELISVIKNEINNNEIKHLITKLTKYVPQRFIRPWFSNKIRGERDINVNKKIIDLAYEFYDSVDNPSFYKFGANETIEIHPLWEEYLLEHLSILTDFTYWNLNKYLQKRNPNVANIPIKLFPPTKRNLSKARQFWSIYIENNTEIKCIYSDKLISQDEFSIDHFLPWSFTGHDQLWNLVPTTKSINSSKSDNLPSEGYLNKFLRLQYNAFHSLLPKHGRKKIYEDYSLLFNLSISDIEAISEAAFIERLENSIKPQMQIARNMGFSDEWKYKILEK